MKLRSVTYALFIAGLAAFSTSSLAAQSLRFGYETSQTDSQHIAAKKFNDLLQERTKVELKLKLFPDSTLGNAQAMISGVRGGTIDMEMSGSNNFAGLSPVMNLLDVPFLFRDTAHAHKTLDGKVGDDLKASLEGKGLKVLAYWENGWRDVTNSRAPVKTPADLKGLKIRTNNSPMNIAAFKVFGANPIPMPFAVCRSLYRAGNPHYRRSGTPDQRRLVSKIFRSAEVPFSDAPRLFPASGGDQQSEV